MLAGIAVCQGKLPHCFFYLFSHSFIQGLGSLVLWQRQSYLPLFILKVCFVPGPATPVYVNRLEASRFPHG